MISLQKAHKTNKTSIEKPHSIFENLEIDENERGKINFCKFEV